MTGAEVDPLVDIYREGRAERDFEFGIERALEALLSMPQFLMRVERQPVDTRPGAVYRLSDLELASRLSFFLWRSIPDDELLDLAASGRLSAPNVLTAQVRRMLDDRRATRFMNDFVGQWLQVRNIHAQDPDGALFAGFNDTLRTAMVRETELFFESQVREDRPVQDLLRADYTFLNEQLARHYGVDDLYGSHFRRVTWDDDRRHGLLGQCQPADGDVVCEPDVGRPAGEVGAGDPARRAAATTAAERAAARRERPEQPDVTPGTDGAAPAEPGLCGLSHSHGPARLRDGAL